MCLLSMSFVLILNVTSGATLPVPIIDTQTDVVLDWDKDGHDDAKLEYIKYKQVEFMSAHLGEFFMGIISGLTDWGMYVELDCA